MSEVRDFIGRAIERMHLKREVYAENQVPESLSKVRIVPFFGDIRSEFVLSTLLLHRLFPKDYLIVCSWPGHWGLYPGIAEYWSPEDDLALGDLSRHLSYFNNERVGMYEKLLLRYFDNISLPSDFVPDYYSDGFTSKYFKEVADIEYVLPTIPSAKITLDGKMGRANSRILLKPTKYINRWGVGREERFLVGEKFWEDLIRSLIKRDYVPIVVQDYSTYDLSVKFSSDCMFVSDSNLLVTLAVMRACDCVLDVFNGLSRYALIARCPYLACDERQRYFNTNDYILDDLCGKKIPKSFIFSFAPLAVGSTPIITEAIINRLDKFLPILDRDTWPSTTQQRVFLSYDTVRKRQSQRIGARFLRVPTPTDY